MLYSSVVDKAFAIVYALAEARTLPDCGDHRGDILGLF